MNFNEKKLTPLCEIMGKHCSDKGHERITTSYHNYTTFYYYLFSSIRYENLRVFELGLGTTNPNIKSNMGPNGKHGASLYGWKDFFSNSNIYGADIDSDILFSEDRIKTFFAIKQIQK